MRVWIAELDYDQSQPKVRVPSDQWRSPGSTRFTRFTRSKAAMRMSHWMLTFLVSISYGRSCENTNGDSIILKLTSNFTDM